MRVAAVLALALVVAGCGGGGAEPPPVEPPPLGEVTADRSISPPPPADDVMADQATVPPTPSVDHAATCELIGQLAAGGDHKPAVDKVDALLADGGACKPEVLASVAESRRRLDEADTLVRRGLEARRAGDVAAARQGFREALEIYPKYYWVERLLSELPSTPDPAAVERLRRAGELRAEGRVEEALALLLAATAAGMAEPELADEIAVVRTELGDLRLGEAHREQRAGNLRRALERTRRAIAAAPGHPVRGRVVDFARRLGLHLFSAGELIEAQAIWQAALSLDQSNELLRQYLDEVETRLRSLDDIKASEID